MTDFKKQLIVLLEREIPKLADRIQAGAVDARTPAPFAAFSVPEETSVRTLHGIAGYRTMFEVAVYDSKFSGTERLKHRVIAALEVRSSTANDVASNHPRQSITPITICMVRRSRSASSEY